MARGVNPYAGQYAPSKLGLNKEELIKALKSIKLKFPNRHMTEPGYAKGLKKETGEK